MTGWMVVYMTEKIKLINGVVVKKLKDHYEPFIEIDSKGRFPKEQARERYDDLIDLMKVDSDIYSVNLCHIKDSTEPDYLEILDERGEPIKKEEKIKK